ncbi:MAG TPA: peptide ABC transporter substrate-binding protein [Symbiobacteriaceae bacterium]|nr:peptide ABC transporter substrate-binding protein [Symbiobacteriaceae bacterium]
MRNRVLTGVAIVMALSLLAGCGGAKTATSAGPAEKIIRFNAGADFRFLDPGLSSDNTSGYAVDQLFEGLTRVTPNGTVPGMAAKWEISPDGTQYTFHLRDGVTWSNGDPVTAEDFAYAWTRVLDPKLGAEYAYQLYYIKGGEAFNTGKGTASDLGIKVIDAKTLQVTLEAPTPYFLDLTAFSTLAPVPKKVVEANPDWAAKAATIVTNGPFSLKTWTPKQEALLVKNPTYWNAANVKVDKLQYQMIEDASTALQLFESGKLDMMFSPPAAEVTRLQQEKKLQLSPLFNTYYYELNTTVAPFGDAKVRRALALAIDREAIVANVTKLNQTPAYAFVPAGAQETTPGSDFRKAGGDLFKADLTEAKRLLAEAGYADGKNFPAIELIYDSNQNHKVLAEAVIEMWRKNLGITTIKASNMEQKVLFERRSKGDFTLARSGWYGDYTDPMTFMDMYVTGSGNNNARYSNPAYDALIKQAKATADQNVRMKAMHEAEAMLVKEMPIIPVYYGVNPYLLSSKVQGVYLSPMGKIDFSTATVQ